MAREAERKSKEDHGSDLSTIDAIRAIAAHNARAELDTEEQLALFLRSWWSRTYNRPLKDPMLLSYTTEELLYEFYDRIERRLAEEERINSDADKIEEDKEQAVLDWAEQEEKRELEALKSDAANEEAKPAPDLLKDPANVKWMEQQLKQAKEIYGETFGEDVDFNFEE
jgi:hypothetical protein